MLHSASRTPTQDDSKTKDNNDDPKSKTKVPPKGRIGQKLEGVVARLLEAAGEVQPQAQTQQQGALKSKAAAAQPKKSPSKEKVNISKPSKKLVPYKALLAEGKLIQSIEFDSDKQKANLVLFPEYANERHFLRLNSMLSQDLQKNSSLLNEFERINKRDNNPPCLQIKAPYDDITKIYSDPQSLLEKLKELAKPKVTLKRMDFLFQFSEGNVFKKIHLDKGVGIIKLKRHFRNKNFEEKINRALDNLQQKTSLFSKHFKRVSQAKTLTKLELKEEYKEKYEKGEDILNALKDWALQLKSQKKLNVKHLLHKGQLINRIERKDAKCFIIFNENYDTQLIYTNVTKVLCKIYDESPEFRRYFDKPVVSRDEHPSLVLNDEGLKKYADPAILLKDLKVWSKPKKKVPIRESLKNSNLIKSVEICESKITFTVDDSEYNAAQVNRLFLKLYEESKKHNKVLHKIFQKPKVSQKEIVLMFLQGKEETFKDKDELISVLQTCALPPPKNTHPNLLKIDFQSLIEKDQLFDLEKSTITGRVVHLIPHQFEGSPALSSNQLQSKQRKIVRSINRYLEKLHQSNCSLSLFFERPKQSEMFIKISINEENEKDVKEIKDVIKILKDSIVQVKKADDEKRKLLHTRTNKKIGDQTEIKIDIAGATLAGDIVSDLNLKGEVTEVNIQKKTKPDKDKQKEKKRKKDRKKSKAVKKRKTKKDASSKNAKSKENAKAIAEEKKKLQQEAEQLSKEKGKEKETEKENDPKHGLAQSFSLEEDFEPSEEDDDESLFINLGKGDSSIPVEKRPFQILKSERRLTLTEPSFEGKPIDKIVFTRESGVNFATITVCESASHGAADPIEINQENSIDTVLSDNVDNALGSPSYLRDFDLDEGYPLMTSETVLLLDEADEHLSNRFNVKESIEPEERVLNSSVGAVEKLAVQETNLLKEKLALALRKIEELTSDKSMLEKERDLSKDLMGKLSDVEKREKILLEDKQRLQEKYKKSKSYAEQITREKEQLKEEHRVSLSSKEEYQEKFEAQQKEFIQEKQALKEELLALKSKYSKESSENEKRLLEANECIEVLSAQQRVTEEKFALKQCKFEEHLAAEKHRSEKIGERAYQEGSHEKEKMASEIIELKKIMQIENLAFQEKLKALEKEISENRECFNQKLCEVSRNAANEKMELENKLFEADETIKNLSVAQEHVQIEYEKIKQELAIVTEKNQILQDKLKEMHAMLGQQSNELERNTQAYLSLEKQLKEQSDQSAQRISALEVDLRLKAQKIEHLTSQLQSPSSELLNINTELHKQLETTKVQIGQLVAVIKKGRATNQFLRHFVQLTHSKNIELINMLQKINDSGIEENESGQAISPGLMMRLSPQLPPVSTQLTTINSSQNVVNPTGEANIVGEPAMHRALFSLSPQQAISQPNIIEKNAIQEKQTSGQSLSAPKNSLENVGSFWKELAILDGPSQSDTTDNSIDEDSFTTGPSLIFSSDHPYHQRNLHNQAGVDDEKQSSAEDNVESEGDTNRYFL